MAEGQCRLFAFLIRPPNLKEFSSLSLMASTNALQASYSLIVKPHNVTHLLHDLGGAARGIRARTRRTNCGSLGVLASQGPSGRQRAPPGVDTRIHWDNEDEGWIGGSSKSQQTEEKLGAEEQQKNLLGEKFADLLNDSSDSHYQFLGVSAEADLEEIKAAYRRLSKEYHPDTTSLPLKAASEKFMKLREVYNVLSSEESRRFYDWTLAQEAASRKAEKLRIRLEDPYQQDLRNYKPKPDMVDRLGGRNMELSDQAMTALTFDVFVIIFAICCIIYVLVFKEPYY
ncbi:PREDICTED: NAD(P)H-quinone oxidoreductase subunit T, chloroplastic [Theobroma cacao]|uniref:NAD(P)H-quinone oxidoreductase subunit T, chloroplastic n=1 Tax=Theobroma cacao TaxID=3641 RepID=A0AB32VMM0_THECC|nr:PREDICTED: NAD(P)H-quinone oxidoreductase subunit T, chloroplastic [Theobroma cacao]